MNLNFNPSPKRSLDPIEGGNGNTENLSEQQQEIRNLEESINNIDQQIADLEAHIVSLKSQRKSMIQELFEKQKEYGVFESKIVITSEMETLKNHLFAQRHQFWNWGSEELFNGFVNPTSINWNQQIEISQKKEYTRNSLTLNPETLTLNYEDFPNPTILFKPEWVGKPKGEVFQEIIREYSKTHYIPGFDYLQWLYENDDKIPAQLKDGNTYFTPGSFFGYSGR